MAMMPRAVGLLKFSSEVFLTCPLRVAMMTETFAVKLLHRQASARTFSPGRRFARLTMALPFPAEPTSGIS